MANEKRLIDANALKSQITRYHTSLTPRYISKLVDAEIGDIIDIIDEAPTVSAVEVVHGKWVTWQELFPKKFSLLSLEKNKGFCSHCGAFRKKDNYCPNCGAKMRGNEE